MKKLTKEAIFNAFLVRGYEVHEMSAGSVNYHTIKHQSDKNTTQVVAAVYGSLTKAASLWVKESTFQSLKPNLPSDALVEDVEPFRRGFQWAIHFENNADELIDLSVDHAVVTAESRLAKTHERRLLEERRSKEATARKEARKETRRDWKDA